ncbi:hypothetical protein [Capnocytophaga catalasegens]|uniref:Peptidase M10 metallopeptidase domain-containing protein n=1 Tax=Capnocytophaga catalasegens TaxID=1004260 RepID=A0AAV5B048_9FLAO|nr:hypothetical protein [Capnocytophaga catalasegens]GIZ16044.1 hypothetical protein RCZ03_20440 [Capnocytophaga catalasegens]GJM51250.1 hypothetical protein RCZ15_22230 [Capnocytophaga catalasegens]GJM53332.1 hypothetical protein RCZ16_16490 [Capnocytophaga catalasegens]
MENPFSLRGKDYYCSFLNVFPNKKIKLSLVRENLINPPLDNSDIVIYFDYEENYFEFSSSEFNFTEIPSEGDSGYKEIELTCISPLTKNTEIKIKIREKDDPKREDDPEVGKLMVMKNDIQYKLNVRFVEVEFKGSLFKKHNIKIRENEEDKEYHIKTSLSFSNGKIKYKNNSPNVLDKEKKVITETTIENWKDYVKDNKQLFKNLLQQSFIIYNPNENYRKITIDFGENREYGTTDFENKGVNKINSTIVSIEKNFINIKYDDKEIMNFLSGLIDSYKETYKEEEKGVIVFLLPINIKPIKVGENKYLNNATNISIFWEENRKEQKVIIYDAFSDSLFKEGKYIMLVNNHIDFIKSTLIHEIAHTLGLFHPFQKREIDPITNRILDPIFIFEEYKTDNIMDYPSETNRIKKQESFFKWQWKIMQNDDIDLIPEKL